MRPRPDPGGGTTAAGCVRLRHRGRYQLEAAIQSAHTAGRFDGATDWRAIIDLYNRLYKLTRSPVVAVNLSAAIANVRGAKVALKLLDELAGGPKLHGYQPYWTTRAHLLERANRWPEAKFAYQRAIGLSADPADPRLSTNFIPTP
jgi:RNA polymerase sigma-70 factor (ECF subfamily)